MRNSVRILVMALSSTAFLHVSRATPTVTSQDVEQSIQKYGARQTLSKLDDSDKLEDNTWYYVEDQMSSGKSEWIALAPKLDSGADAEASESLGLCLASSLPKNPEVVLSVSGSGNITIERVCSIPFIEETAPNLAAYKREAIAAVKSVHNPAYAAKKVACLAALEAS